MCYLQFACSISTQDGGAGEPSLWSAVFEATTAAAASELAADGSIAATPSVEWQEKYESSEVREEAAFKGRILAT